MVGADLRVCPLRANTYVRPCNQYMEFVARVGCISEASYTETTKFGATLASAGQIKVRKSPKKNRAYGVKEKKNKRIKGKKGKTAKKIN